MVVGVVSKEEIYFAIDNNHTYSLKENQTHRNKRFLICISLMKEKLRLIENLRINNET